jgi:triosephosphate isomerase
MGKHRRPLIAGNWKMNGLRADGLALANGIAAKAKAAASLRCDLLVSPPATLIAEIASAVKGSPVAVGGQDCHAKESGAHTGDVSAHMLADAGASFVILGHSERRTDHGEKNEAVKAKAEAAIAAGLVAIVCIGETEAERDSGKTLEVVRSQLLGSLPQGATAANTVIAYEPVWAIGTGRTPTTPEVAEVHAVIRREAGVKMSDANRLRILYGGSMKPSNAKELLALEDVDGGLIGGASLKVEDFWAIAESCP